MAAKLSTCFVSHGWNGLNSNNSNLRSSDFTNHQYHRLLPASCKMRQSNLREFEGIASQFQNHENARLILKYDKALSHSIYAASDIFIIPFIFEPCGLTQMIAMRYGSIPIARKTGGLNDSVFDVDDETIPVQFRNGFTFSSPDEQGLNSALDCVVHRCMNNREGWDKLVQKVMNIDFSWESSAAQSEELYARSVARARTTKRF